MPIQQDRTSKKILLVTHFLPPSHTAGTEQYTLALGKTLQTKGFEVSILCAEDWEAGEKYWNGVTEETLDGVPVLRIHLNWMKAKRTNRALYNSEPVEEWLDRFLVDHRFDIVHVISTYSLGVGVLRSVKRANIPLVLTLMDFWFLCPSLQLLRSDGELCDGDTTPWQCESCLMANSYVFNQVKKVSIPEPLEARFWDSLSHINTITRHRGMRGMLLDMSDRKKVMKESFALPDLVISPSKIVQTMFAKNMDRPVEFLPYHHDLSWVKGYRGKTKSDMIRIGYLGQIQNIKGVHLLVDAFIKAGIENKARLDIWGNYSANPKYELYLRNRMGNAPSIFLRGGYKREQLSEILEELDLVVVPSVWYENAPLVIQEAFAVRTPVIATNLGGMSEAVKHDVNGLLFDRNDSDDLARQLKRVVNEDGLFSKLTNGIPSLIEFQSEEDGIIAMYERLITHQGV